MPVATPATGKDRKRPVRTLWLGMRCEFTRAAIAGALEADGQARPVSIVLPRAPKPLGAGWPELPFDRWLREREVAIIEVDRLAGADLTAVAEAIGDLRIDLGVGACFPWKVPAALRGRLPGGALNIHPSLLPALRGPEPVFHAYRLGLTETGVTVHVMDDGWDSGPVLAREQVPVPETGSSEAFEAELARRGGRLLSSVARRWCEGVITPAQQDEAAASWAPVPGDADRVVPAGLTVAQATRFVHACAPLVAVDADSGEPVAVSGVIPMEGGDVGVLREDRSAVRAAFRDGDQWFRRQPGRGQSRARPEVV